MEVLKWLRLENDPPCSWNEWNGVYVVSADGLDALKWRRFCNHILRSSEVWTCKFAAKKRPLDILKWLLENDSPCPWNEWTSEEVMCIEMVAIREESTMSMECVELWVCC